MAFYGVLSVVGNLNPVHVKVTTWRANKTTSLSLEKFEELTMCELNDNVNNKSFGKKSTFLQKNASQPYSMVDTHFIETGIIQEIIIKDELEDCIDIDEVQIVDTELNSDINIINLDHQLSGKETEAYSLNDICSTSKPTITTSSRNQLQQVCRSKLKTSGRSSFLNKVKFKSNASKALFSMQILPRRKEEFTKAEKTLALSLFYKSPSTYKFLLKQQIILPSIDQLRTWMGNIDFDPGLNATVLSKIKHKVSTMEDREKACILIYCSVRIHGTPECLKAKITPELQEDKSKIHTDALVFVLRGLYSNWTLPLAYFSREMNTRILSTNLIESVRESLNSGLMVCGVFGDLDYASKYPDVLAALGVIPEKPYFLVENIKVFGFVNIFSLYEIIKYHWTTNDFIFCGDQVSLRDVMHAFRYKFAEVNSKISINDFPPIFSRSTSSIIKQAGKDGKLNSKIAKDTANFVKYLSNVYEVLNSKEFEPHRFLFIMEKTLNKIKKGVYQVHKEPKSQAGLPIFKHLETSLRTIIMFCLEYEPKDYPFLVMKCPVYVVISRLFSFGKADPTIESFRNKFREAFVDCLMQPLNEH